MADTYGIKGALRTTAVLFVLLSFFIVLVPNTVLSDPIIQFMGIAILALV